MLEEWLKAYFATMYPIRRLWLIEAWVIWQQKCRLYNVSTGSFINWRKSFEDAAVKIGYKPVRHLRTGNKNPELCVEWDDESSSDRIQEPVLY